MVVPLTNACLTSLWHQYSLHVMDINITVQEVTSTFYFNEKKLINEILSTNKLQLNCSKISETRLVDSNSAVSPYVHHFNRLIDSKSTSLHRNLVLFCCCCLFLYLEPLLRLELQLSTEPRAATPVPGPSSPSRPSRWGGPGEAEGKKTQRDYKRRPEPDQDHRESSSSRTGSRLTQNTVCLFRAETEAGRGGMIRSV